METTDEYIFRECEFEDSNFHAATFVAKYRRVNSLEFLKDQLRQYTDGLKNELYLIINRDYKDFINIATKLEGVDTRVEHLRKPLIDLRLNLSTLHEGMLSNRQAIQDKLKRRSEVSNKIANLRGTVALMDMLDSADDILKTSITSSEPSQQARKFTRRDLLRAMSNPCQDAAISGAASTLECSELERAAYTLNRARICLKALCDLQGQDVSASVTGASGRVIAVGAKAVVAGASAQTVGRAVTVGQGQGALGSVSSGLGVLPQLSSRVQTLVERVVQQAGQRLVDMLLSHVRGIQSANSNLSTGLFPDQRAFCHCLRALEVLGRVDVAERAVADHVVLPLAKSVLTQGQVDGAGGRGSFFCLQQSLVSLHSSIRALLEAPLCVAEDLNSFSLLHQDNKPNIINSDENLFDGEKDKLDLVCRGVWQPVLGLVMERFPAMFSVAIANTMACCFNAMETFNVLICDISGDKWRDEIAKRQLRSPTMSNFRAKWNFDLYYQLRLQEICSRIDVAVNFGATQEPKSAGIMVNVFDHVYANQPSTIATEDYESLMRSKSLGIFQLPIIRVFVLEMITTMKSNVVLSGMGSKFLTLALRLLLRLEAHVVLCADLSSSPSFGRNAIANCQQQQLQAMQSKTAVTPTVPGTPGHSKSPATGGGASPAMTPSKGASVIAPSPGSVNNSLSTSYVPIACALEELVLLCCDLCQVEKWLRSSYVDHVVCAMKAAATPHLTQLAAQGQLEFVSNLQTAVEKCLTFSGSKLSTCREAVWAKVCGMLTVDCKKALASVRVIAGKYRMTNKPAPEQASGYVETLLQPLKLFIEKHESSVVVFVPRGQWDLEIVEEVSVAFASQVQSLLDTVKQMDTALQRRSKMRAAPQSAAGGAAQPLSDSDKIALQVFLDVKAFGDEIVALGLNLALVKSFTSLFAEVSEAKKLIGS